LEVLRSLGYEKRPPQQAQTYQNGSFGSTSVSDDSAPSASRSSAAEQQEGE
jgi:hypothetical protein